MCGIVGVYSFEENIESHINFIHWANATMEKRGPDSDGLWHNNRNYISGFRRLAIRDLSSHANQPMVSDCGNYVITFNGEIYNTDFYKKDLIARGVNLVTTSDTEILLYSIIHFGIRKVLENLDGIFAFGFYDNQKNDLFIVRDRSGVKPLYYGVNSHGLVFSSQYDHIINHPYFRENTVDPSALGAYLQLGYTPEGNGLIENTYFLPHGHFLKISNGKVSELESYFEYPMIENKLNGNGKMSEYLSEAVNSQLVSDVAIGTFMSGGVDSPLVSYFANQNQQIKSFNIGVDDPQFDESEAAKEYAKIFNTDHHLKMISEKDLLETISDNTKAYSEPFADYSSIPTLILSKFAKEKVTVVLSGDGGDELYWGYPRNNTIRKQHKDIIANKSLIFSKLLYEKITKAKPRTVSSKFLKYSNFAEFYYHTLFISGAAQWVPKIVKNKPLIPFFYQKVLNGKYNEKDINSCMNLMRKLEFDLHLQRILIKVDRASMYHSLEVRVPLLSNAIINHSISKNYDSCMQNQVGKSNLKNLLASVSDEKLVYMPKKGFSIPLARWIRQELKKDVTEKLNNIPSELNQYFDSNQIQEMISQHYNKTNDWSWNIWALYSLINWHSYHRNMNVNFNK